MSYVTFAGVDLEGVTDWEEPIDAILAAETIPRQDGAYFDPIPSLAAREINLKGRIVKTTFAAVKNAIDEMLHVFGTGEQQLKKDTDRYIMATRQSFTFRLSTYVAEWDLSLICRDPFWYAVDITEIDDSLTGSVQENVNITPSGTALTPIVFKITPDAELTELRILNSNVFVKKDIRFDGTLATGVELSIDFLNKTATSGGVANALNYITGDFWMMRGGELNQLQITADENSDYTIQYRNRWY